MRRARQLSQKSSAVRVAAIFIDDLRESSDAKYLICDVPTAMIDTITTAIIVWISEKPLAERVLFVIATAFNSSPLNPCRLLGFNIIPADPGTLRTQAKLDT